ncbi:MAG: type II toxin-antitoxin system RelE/ParE family toxin [Candidatus Sungbacteria bacterium]|nr:type II toxin-antitoxin system RelE/ParE family toxin [bacterium]MDZ4285314.1 type II toxin-antitoxin system RelE/ParE family toxin [Candidatus Sungbacteria bacterium]
MKVRILDIDLEKFIHSLDAATIAKVLRTVDLLETFGYKLGAPHSKKVYVDLFELRVRGKQEVRIVYTFHKDEAMLLHGFIKKSNRIPKKELSLAIRKREALD